MPRIPVKIAMNVGNPELAFEFAQLPNAGVGLARLEFIINNRSACTRGPASSDADSRPSAEEAGRNPRLPGCATFFGEKLVEGIATIAAAFCPKKVIVRLSDFKSNEYKNLLGGERYEPDEENPMLGFRGASRYIAPDLPRELRARVQGDAQGARGDGPHERRGDDPVRAHRRTRRAR